MGKDIYVLSDRNTWTYLTKEGNWVEPDTMGLCDIDIKTIKPLDPILACASKEELLNTITEFKEFKKNRLKILLQEDLGSHYEIEKIEAYKGCILFYNDLTKKEIAEIELKYHDDENHLLEPILEFSFGGYILSEEPIHPKCKKIPEGFLFHYYFI